MKRPVAISGAVAIAAILFAVTTEAAPRKSGKGGVDPTAKKVDLFKAAEAKQVNVQVTVNSPGVATLTLSNTSEEALNVEVPLYMAAEPFDPTKGFPGGRGFGNRVPTPQTLAVAVNPQWTAGVDKKSKKTGVKTNKKKEEEAEKADEKKDEKDAKADDKKADSGVALVPVPAGGIQSVPLYTVGLETPTTRPVPAAGIPYTLGDFDKRIQAPEMKKLMENLVKGTVPPDSAQLLAWHYNGRLTWEEMQTSGLINPIQLPQAQHYADVVEGRAAPDAPAPQTASKKRKR